MPLTHKKKKLKKNNYKCFTLVRLNCFYIRKKKKNDYIATK